MGRGGGCHRGWQGLHAQTLLPLSPHHTPHRLALPRAYLCHLPVSTRTCLSESPGHRIPHIRAASC